MFTDADKNCYLHSKRVSIFGKSKIKHKRDTFLYQVQEIQDIFYFDYKYSSTHPKLNKKKDKQKSPKNPPVQKYYQIQPINLHIQKSPIDSPIQKSPSPKLATDSPIQKSPSPKLATDSPTRKSPNQKPKVSGVSKTAQNDDDSENENCLLIAFVIDGFYPMKKSVPLSNTISQVKEMIANEKGLKKEKISIKYTRNNQKVELEPDEKISDISDLINDQNQLKKSIKQFKPVIKREDDDEDDDNDNDNDNNNKKKI